MTKKHYIMLSNLFALAKDYAIGCEQAEYVWRTLAKSMANELERDSPRFDKKRFLKACRLEERK